MTIRFRLLLGYLGIAAALVVAGDIGLRTAREVTVAFHGVVQQDVPLVQALQDVRVGTLRVVASTTEYGFILAEGAHVHGDDGDGNGQADGQATREAALIDDGVEDLNAALSAASALAAVDRDLRVPDMVRLRAAADSLIDRARALVRLKQRGVAGEEVLEAKEEFEAAEEACLALLDGCIDGELSDVAQSKQAAIRSINASVAVQVAANAASILLAIVIGLAVSRSISRPIAALGAAARRVESGHFDLSIEQTRIPDVQRVADAFQSMAQRLSQTVSELQAEAVVRREGEQREVKLRELAEAANRAKSEFLANMSHELRTPLNGILGMTELTLATNLDPEQTDLLHCVLECSNSLLELVNEILDFSKAEAGRIEVAAEDFDILSVVNSTADALGHQAARKGLELVLTVHPDVPRMLRGDAQRLRQVLVNLGGNAVKFTERGEVELRMEVEERTDQAVRLLVSVRDTGIGIPPEAQRKIFESFTQVDGSISRRYGGTGLGLAISRRLIERMGGAIGVTSEPGRGSTFHVRITLPLAGPAAQGQAGGDSSGSNPNLALAGRRILVVDDNATNRRLLQLTLESWGCSVVLAPSGAQALDGLQRAELRGERFDLLILDVQMPDMDGFEVEQRVRERTAHQSLPVLFLSSLGPRSSHAPASSPTRIYLSKPVKQSALMETLVELMATQANPAVITGQPTAAGAKQPAASVLVVEDNPVNRKLAVRILEKCSCEATTAENGREALAMLEERSFDLVLMDVQMPEMDGFEATGRLRADGRFTDLPVIAMTAHAMKGDRERCLAAGMNDYISKPMRPDDLRRLLLKWTSHDGGLEVRTGEASPDPIAGSAPMDLREALEQAGGDHDLLRDVLETFVASLPQLLSEFRAGAASGDAPRVAEAAHSLRGSTACLAAEPVREAARRLEQLARQGNIGAAAPTIGELESHLERLSVFAAEWLSQDAP